MKSWLSGSALERSSSHDRRCFSLLLPRRKAEPWHKPSPCLASSVHPWVSACEWYVCLNRADMPPQPLLSFSCLFLSFPSARGNEDGGSGDESWKHVVFQGCWPWRRLLLGLRVGLLNFEYIFVASSMWKGVALPCLWHWIRNAWPSPSSQHQSCWPSVQCYFIHLVWVI